ITGKARLAIAAAMLEPSLPRPTIEYRISLGSRRGELWLVYRSDQLVAHLVLDPTVRAGETLLEGDLRFPPEHRAQTGVVRVATADTLRAGDVALRNLDPSD